LPVKSDKLDMIGQNFVIQRWWSGHDDKVEVYLILGTCLFRGDKLDMID